MFKSIFCDQRVSKSVYTVRWKNIGRNKRLRARQRTRQALQKTLFYSKWSRIIFKEISVGKNIFVELQTLTVEYYLKQAELHLFSRKYLTEKINVNKLMKYVLKVISNWKNPFKRVDEIIFPRSYLLKKVILMSWWTIFSRSYLTTVLQNFILIN